MQIVGIYNKEIRFSLYVIDIFRISVSVVPWKDKTTKWWIKQYQIVAKDVVHKPNKGA